MIINKVINIIYDFSGRIPAFCQGVRRFILTSLALTLVSLSAFASSDSLQIVYKIDIKEEIGPGIARKLSKAMNEASSYDAKLIVVHINTYGGLLDAADSIRTRLLNSEIPVVAFIDNNAASAGALISIACNRIYMRSGSSIGAATVVDQNATALPDKYQSYMRSMMRATAEKRGRDPLIAEAMVDQRTIIPGVIDSGKVLTFTTSEAIKNGYCEKQVETIEEVIKEEGFGNYTLKFFEPSAIDNIISFLINPAVSGVLLLLILGGIYYELQTPGLGFPIAASLLAAILYFAPLYLEGMAANWEILLAVFGFILLGVEVLILPGFGVAGISGVILLFTAFTFSMINNDGFNFDMVPEENIKQAATVVMLAFIGTVVMIFSMGMGILRTKRFKRLILSDTMEAVEGYTSSDNNFKSMIGAEGITVTYLRPSGKISIDDNIYTANAERGFIESGKKVVVSRFDGLILWVNETSE